MLDVRLGSEYASGSGVLLIRFRQISHIALVVFLIEFEHVNASWYYC